LNPDAKTEVPAGPFFFAFPGERWLADAEPLPTTSAATTPTAISIRLIRFSPFWMCVDGVFSGILNPLGREG
jgi:hypothetical protein